MNDMKMEGNYLGKKRELQEEAGRDKRIIRNEYGRSI